MERYFFIIVVFWHIIIPRDNFLIKCCQEPWDEAVSPHSEGTSLGHNDLEFINVKTENALEVEMCDPHFQASNVFGKQVSLNYRSIILKYFIKSE